MPQVLRSGPSRMVPVALLLVLAACRAEPRAEEPPSGNGDTPSGLTEQVAFFENLRSLCGNSYAGSTELATAPDHPQPDVRLMMHVRDCEPDELRIPFHVGENRSRTWILTRHEDGLLFKHDQRHEDGSPEDLTNYGGWADERGAPTRQSFPADVETVDMLPEAATNVWTLELDDGRFVYDLQRHGQPRFRATFDTSTPVDADDFAKATP